MKYTKIIATTIILAAVNNAFGSSYKYKWGIDEIVKQIQYIETNQQKVWPGFHPDATATIIAADQYAYGLHYTPKTFPWEKLPSTDVPIYFLKNAYDLPVSYHDYDRITTIEDQPCFYHKNTAKPEDFVHQFITQRANYFMKHESGITSKNFSYLNFSYDGFNHADLLKLLKLEQAALFEVNAYIAGGQDIQAEESLRDAVAIHQYRSQLLSPKHKAYENANEIYTGTSNYINYASEQHSHGALKVIPPDSCQFSPNHWDNDAVINCVTEDHQAYADALYGLMLDKKFNNAAWKNEVESKFKSISQLMQDYYHFRDEEAALITKNAMKKIQYGYSRYSRIIDNTIVPYIKAMNKTKNAYIALDGIEVQAGIEWATIPIFFGSDYYILDTNTALIYDISINDQRDENYIQLPFMLVYEFFNNDGNYDESKSYVKFKLSHKAKLIIDGTTQSAYDFVRARKVKAFKKLVIEDQSLRDHKSHGILDASDGILHIQKEFNETSSVKKIDLTSRQNSKLDKLKKPFVSKFIRRLTDENLS